LSVPAGKVPEMDTNTVDAADTAEGRRAAMVEMLRHYDVIRSEAVEAAMRAVPRHAFVPEVPVETAYSNEPIVTKRYADGGLLSCASEPGVIAKLLEQLAVEHGQRVLAIGAGTGYNAALLAYLAGESGEVTTIEYDAETADRAGRPWQQQGMRTCT
jgi:protein-L-isoaspartate(D-aspartate) O-methyltransferase